MRRCGRRQRAPGDAPRNRCDRGLAPAPQLLGEASAPPEQHGSRRALERAAHLDRDQVRPQIEHRTASSVGHTRQSRPARADQRLEGSLKLLGVGRGTFVQDHEIDGEEFRSPVLVGAEQLAQQREVIGFVEPDQDDRKVPGDAVGPERCGSLLVPFEHGRGGPQRWIREEHVVREALVEMRLVRSHAEVMQLDLGLGPRERRCALERRRILVLVGEIEHRAARRGDQRPERHPHGRTGLDPDTTAETEDRIENRADGARERSAIPNRERRAQRPSAAQEARPIALELQRTQPLALDHCEMCGEGLRLGGRTPPPAGEQGADLGDELGLYEQVGEDRMRHVGGGRCEDDLGVGRELDLADAAAADWIPKPGAPLRRPRRRPRPRAWSRACRRGGRSRRGPRRTRLRTRPARRRSAGSRPTTPRRSASRAGTRSAPDASQVTSSRQRVTARSRQRL